MEKPAVILFPNQHVIRIPIPPRMFFDSNRSIRKAQREKNPTKLFGWSVLRRGLQFNQQLETFSIELIAIDGFDKVAKVCYNWQRFVCKSWKASHFLFWITLYIVDREGLN